MEKPKAKPRPKSIADAKKPSEAKDKVIPKPKPLSVNDRVAAYTADKIIDDISNGIALTNIAGFIGISPGNLSDWIARNEECSARAREARVYAARIWDEKAVSEIEMATDPFTLSRAKELAHHYRWRASKTAPKDYGDKVVNEHTGANGGAIQVASTVTFVRPAAVKDEE